MPNFANLRGAGQRPAPPQGQRPAAPARPGVQGQARPAAPARPPVRQATVPGRAVPQQGQVARQATVPQTRMTPTRPAGPPTQARPRASAPIQQPARGGRRQAAPVSTNPFEGMGQARARRQGVYKRDGDYIERIERVISKTHSHKKVPIFIIETTILGVLANGEDGNAHRIGEVVTHYIERNTQYPQYYLGDIKAFACAALMCGEDEFDHEDAAEISAEHQPLAGLVVETHYFLMPSEDDAGNVVYRVKNSYNRRIYAEELPSMLDEQTLATYFPGDALQKLADQEAALDARRGGDAPPAGDEMQNAAMQAQPIAEDANGNPLYDDGNGGYLYADGTPCETQQQDAGPDVAQDQQPYEEDIPF